MNKKDLIQQIITAVIYIAVGLILALNPDMSCLLYTSRCV